MSDNPEYDRVLAEAPEVAPPAGFPEVWAPDSALVQDLEGDDMGREILRLLALPPMEPSPPARIPPPGWSIERGVPLQESAGRCVPDKDLYDPASWDARCIHCRRPLATVAERAALEALGARRLVRRSWWQRLGAVLGVRPRQRWVRPRRWYRAFQVAARFTAADYAPCPVLLRDGLKESVQAWEAEARALVAQLQAELAGLKTPAAGRVDP